ncbi:MAG: aldo/keto reductase [bacterium]|nr:MAG: aldo/keto reductase [bacterium]
MDKNRINRREFMGKTTLGLFSTAVGIPLIKSNQDKPEKEQKIIHRTLGRTKLQIPIVSFGVMNSDSPDLLRKAVDKGVRYLDTAHVYLRGNSENVIGQVLEETKMRKEVIVGTKMRFARDRDNNTFLLKGNAREPGATEENLNKQLDLSLRRLRSNYVDILYIHSCYSPQMATFEPLMKALVKAKEAGKARFIGISTHSNIAEVMQAAVNANIYDVLLVSYNFMQQDRDEVKKAIAYAANKGIGIIAMKTQGGRRSGKEGQKEINHKAALKWVLNDENVCTSIPGMTSFDQLDMNFSVMNDLSLSDQEKKDLKMSYMMKDSLYCQNCRSCIATCPNSVEIPNLMRAYMYAEGYGNLIQAGITIEELPKNRGIEICAQCSSCIASCRYGKNIKHRITTLINNGFNYT